MPQGAVRRLDRAARFNASHGLKQLGRFDLADRQAAKPGKYVLLEADECASSVPCTHLSRMNRRMPFARHRFETVAGDFRPDRFLGLADCARVNALRDQTACLVALLPDGLQTRVGIGSE